MSIFENIKWNTSDEVEKEYWLSKDDTNQILDSVKYWEKIIVENIVDEWSEEDKKEYFDLLWEWISYEWVSLNDFDIENSNKIIFEIRNNWKISNREFEGVVNINKLRQYKLFHQGSFIDVKVIINWFHSEFMEIDLDFIRNKMRVKSEDFWRWIIEKVWKPNWFENTPWVYEFIINTENEWKIIFNYATWDNCDFEVSYIDYIEIHWDIPF
jgi:hypothetical protein